MRRPATATAVLTAPCHAPPARPPRAARHAWAVRLTRRLGSYGITAALGAGALAAVLPMCAPPPPPTIQQQVVDLTNARRAENGLAPLTVNGTLTAVAQAHAADQASVDRMSHTGTDGSDAGTRIMRSGYPTWAWGENVAGGYTSADAVVAAWMNSPSHRANMLNGFFTQIGIGIAYAADGTAYWSMELGRPW
jgi:uncharacterized protein YkwD